MYIGTVVLYEPMPLKFQGRPQGPDRIDLRSGAQSHHEDPIWLAGTRHDQQLKSGTDQVWVIELHPVFRVRRGASGNARSLQPSDGRQVSIPG